MAEESAEKRRVNEALLRRIEASRKLLGDDIAELKEKVNIPKQIKRKIGGSVMDHPMGWFGGAAGAGFLASRLFKRRGPKGAQKKNRRLAIFSILLTLLRPLIEKVITSELQRRFKDHPMVRQFLDQERFPLSKSAHPRSKREI